MRVSDEAEFGEVVAASAHSLRRTAYLMCGDWHQAEDLVQVAFMKLHASWHRVRRQEAVDAYLRRILIRACVDEKRRARWRREAPTAEPPDLPAPDSAGAPDGVRDVLVGCLRELPPGQRATLVLRFFADLSVEQTAQAMGCSVGTVKSQTAKGLAALRVMIAPFELRPTEAAA